MLVAAVSIPNLPVNGGETKIMNIIINNALLEIVGEKNLDSGPDCAERMRSQYRKCGQRKRGQFEPPSVELDCSNQPFICRNLRTEGSMNLMSWICID